MAGLATAVASLGPIVTTPVPSRIVPPLALLRVRLNVSAPSARASSMIGTTTVRTVSPGAKTRVPLVVV